MLTLAISCLSIQFTLIHGPNIPGFYAVLFFIASDFTFTTRRTHNLVSGPLWLCLFSISGAISLLFPSSILDSYQPGGFIFQSHTFLPFHTVHGFSLQEYWSGLPFPLQWTTFSQNSPLWPIYPGWPYTVWLIPSLNYSSPFIMIRLWSMKNEMFR